jgi:hypothetical protein
VNQLGNLLLQALILLHEKFVHRCQLSVHGLKPGRLLPLLIPAPNTMNKGRKIQLERTKIDQHPYRIGKITRIEYVLAICSEQE